MPLSLCVTPWLAKRKRGVCLSVRRAEGARLGQHQTPHVAEVEHTLFRSKTAAVLSVHLEASRATSALGAWSALLLSILLLPHLLLLVPFLSSLFSLSFLFFFFVLAPVRLSRPAIRQAALPPTAFPPASPRTLPVLDAAPRPACAPCPSLLSVAAYNRTRAAAPLPPSY